MAELVIDLGKCLRRRVKWSTCTACADSCPEDAIEVTQYGIRVNDYLCTLCLNCVGACPTSAITCSGCGLERLWEPGSRASEVVVGCISGADVRVCINALRLEHYIVAARSRTVRVRVACRKCGLRGRGLRVLEEAKRLLGDRVVVEEEDRAPQPSRRRLIARLARVAAAGVDTARVSTVESPPQRVSPKLYREAWKAAHELGLDYQRLTPVLADPSRCDLCGFCAAVCPTGAILALEDGVLAIDNASCLSCGECVSQCPRTALTMGQADGQTRVYQVDVAVCPLCGNTYPRSMGECPKCLQLRREIIEFYVQRSSPGR